MFKFIEVADSFTDQPVIINMSHIVSVIPSDPDYEEGVTIGMADGKTCNAAYPYSEMVKLLVKGE